MDNTYYEARGEPEVGQLLVMRTVINRAAIKNKPLCSIVYQKDQYSWTRNYKSKPNNEQWQKIASLTNKAYDYRHPVTHFHSIKIKPPGWTRRATTAFTVGGHTFYSGLPDMPIPPRKVL